MKRQDELDRLLVNMAILLDLSGQAPMGFGHTGVDRDKQAMAASLLLSVEDSQKKGVLRLEDVSGEVHIIVVVHRETLVVDMDG